LRSRKIIEKIEELFEALFNSFFQGIFIHDKGIIIDGNPAFAKMIGYKAGELIGVNVIDTLVLPEYRNLVCDKMVNGFEEPYEINVKNKSGAIFPVIIVSAKEVRYKSRNLRLTVVIDSDSIAGDIAHDVNNIFSSKIMIVDDHPIVCFGMTELINKEPDLMVSVSEDTADKAWAAIKKYPLDLVIIGISLNQGNGIDLVEKITREYPDLPVLVLSMYDEILYAERALMAGAHGFIMKHQDIRQVVKAIRQILAGEIYASQEIKDKALKRLVFGKASDKKNVLAILTNRELEVFRLIGDGLESKEIADRLNLSIKTIATHRENIKKKLNLKNYTKLVQAAAHWSQKMKK